MSELVCGDQRMHSFILGLTVSQYLLHKTCLMALHKGILNWNASTYYCNLTLHVVKEGHYVLHFKCSNLSSD